jgi:hypothetical protein
MVASGVLENTCGDIKRKDAHIVGSLRTAPVSASMRFFNHQIHLRYGAGVQIKRLVVEGLVVEGYLYEEEASAQHALELFGTYQESVHAKVLCALSSLQELEIKVSGYLRPS